MINWEQQFVESFITKLVNPPVHQDALIDLVIQKIKSDLENGDETDTAELLSFISTKNLLAFLGEY